MDQGNVKASAGAAIRSRSRRAKTEGTNREMKGLSRRLSLGSKRTAVVQIISSQVQSARQAARQSLDSFSTGPLFEENDLARIEDALFQAHLTGKSAVKAITDDLKEIEDLVAQIEKRELDEFSSRTGLPVAAVKIAGRFEFGPEYEDGMCDRLKSVCIVCKYKLRCQEDKFGDWGTQLLKFVDFVISRKHLLHFLRIFWRLMGDVMSETEKENGWVTVKGLAYIAMAQAPLMNNKPSLVAAAIMRIALHLFFNRGQLPEDKVLEVISSLLHEESQYVPIATKLLDWVLSGKMTSIPKIIRVFEANQYHPTRPSKQIQFGFREIHWATCKQKLAQLTCILV
ncbi:unnamed protein product, partial [Mesorhabditis belari]|uniref:Uncharacterized protein n=1 Tax=Mesorhabditis belari TaxID=2138241 RepID=A0AAF3EYX7_9BILA